MKSLRTEITEGLTAMGVAADETAVEALALHLEMLAEANATFNLTAIAPEQAVALHLLDSLAALPFLADAPAGEFADLGSGAGFPGIPLAILSERPVALVESVGKKAAFLERVVATLRLKASVHGIRAEELGKLHPASYFAVTARAVSSLPALVELASPLLVQNGVLICLKGAPEESELARGDIAASRCGMARIITRAVSVPGVDAQRTVVVYRRRGKSDASLPRRNGMAQRQPLA
jgi:16S rRNA (guanine527-N7)-methyltransferase